MTVRQVHIMRSKRPDRAASPQHAQQKGAARQAFEDLSRAWCRWCSARGRGTARTMIRPVMPAAISFFATPGVTTPFCKKNRATSPVPAPRAVGESH